jgi:hypothetical protein
MQYKLLKNSISGRKGTWIDVDGNDARQLAAVGLIDLGEHVSVQVRTMDLMGNEATETKIIGPEVTKVDGPQVKKRGRPAKVRDASDTAD